MPCWYLSTQVLIMRIISIPFHQADTDSSSTPSSHCLSAACNMHRFSLSLPPCCCAQQPRDKDGNLPTAGPNLISMEIGSSLPSSCACFQVPLRSESDPASQSGKEEKRKIKWYHYFYLIQRLQCETANPSACGRRTPIHSRNPVFVPAVCCPPLPLPCPLSKERQHSKDPFLLFCRASWYPPSCLGWWR